MTAPPDFEKEARDLIRSSDGPHDICASGSDADWLECAERLVVLEALRSAYEAGRASEREAVIVKLCNEHVHEDDLIAWLRARANKGADRGK
jgi:hypothetical protein